MDSKEEYWGFVSAKPLNDTRWFEKFVIIGGLSLHRSINHIRLRYTHLVQRNGEILEISHIHFLNQNTKVFVTPWMELCIGWFNLITIPHSYVILTLRMSNLNHFPDPLFKTFRGSGICIWECQEVSSIYVRNFWLLILLKFGLWRIMVSNSLGRKSLLSLMRNGLIQYGMVDLYRFWTMVYIHKNGSNGRCWIIYFA